MPRARRRGTSNQRPVPELVVVADSFHVKPLMRILQSADRYQVLGLNRREIKLYQGNRDVLDETSWLKRCRGRLLMPSEKN
jgi:hypothetical protein